MGQEVHEGLPRLLDKISKVSRRIMRSAGLKGLKGKISNLGKVSMQSSSGLSDKVNVCPVASKHIKSNIKVIFQINPSLILNQVMICRPPIKHSRVEHCLKEIISIIIGLEVHGLQYLFKIKGIWARIIGSFSD